MDTVCIVFAITKWFITHSPRDHEMAEGRDRGLQDAALQCSKIKGTLHPMCI